MNLLETWIQTPGATALVWTLLHSLWEGAIVALVLAAAFCVIRGSRARYMAACLALLVMLAGFGLTFALLVREQGLASASARTGPIRLAPPNREAGGSAMNLAPRGVAGYLPWLAPFWIAGVLLFHLHSVAGWIGARRLRRTGVCCAPVEWQQRLDRLAARLRISGPVVLWESCLADVPLVIGFLRPVILLPVGLLAGLPAGQVEALLLHELAHIRRYDYLVNLLQVFVEGLLFYHPAVWWMAAMIRAERENCCDDLVVATLGDAYQYATALTALEHNRGDAHQAALAANGGSLVKRIRRLLAQPETPRSLLTPVLSAAILTVTLVAVMAAWQSKPAVPAPPPATVAVPGSTASPRPVKLLAQAQRKQGTAAGVDVESPYAKWLKEDVAYIISDAERAAFKKLQSDAEREHFIEQFWLRRDPTPGTPENEFKQEHYRRIAYTNDHFTANVSGWKTDRGRVYITYGPPDEKESHPSGGQYQRPPQEGGRTTTTFPFEQWLYHYIEGVGTNIIIEFVDSTGTGEYRMTTDPSEKDALLPIPGPRVKRAPTLQVLGGLAAISVPLGDYQDHGVTISGRILTREGRIVTAFEDSVQTPAPNYVKTVPLAAGQVYRLELTVKDLATGKSTADTREFEMK
jgi:GWxTD domain-containing protein